MKELMECEHSEQMTALMSLALDELLEDGDQRRLTEHVTACQTCRSEWQAMQQVAALFEGAPMVGPPLGFAIRVERRLEEKTKKRRQLFGGLALLTSSLSLAGVTMIVALTILFGIVTWNKYNASPAVEEGTVAVSQLASSMSLVGKGASFFLGDLLLHVGAPLVILLGIGLTVLLAVWIWLFLKRPGGRHRNGFA
jgi:predicted anti-sigma-YlaC factor YlaD